MIVLIDNYDSFTYNIVQRIGEIDPTVEVRVFRNDTITIDEIETMKPDRILISPGPCTPNEAGISNDVIRHFAPKVPIFGVCLGHQCIGHVFGGKVIRASRLMHGKTSEIQHDNRGVFAGMGNPFTATRYHSLMVEEESLPECLEISARTVDQNELMGLRHKQFRVEGVQFHPESFLTQQGHAILSNFLKLQGL
ncbi:MAG: aminodeoxychorismate/anthranilate synthase component II [Phycisphaerae bacterium]|nr:aminodeoxychorismate/anthranilate synthase component II [Phycisphaerae bacterium]